jgi:hypothetical protein
MKSLVNTPWEFNKSQEAVTKMSYIKQRAPILKGVLELYNFLRIIFLKVIARSPQGHFDKEKRIF